MNEEQKTTIKQNPGKIISLEKLNNYLKLTHTGVWILLVGIVVILVGTIIWAFSGNISVTADTDVHVDGKTVQCSLSEKDFSRVREGMIVKYFNTNAVITDIKPAGDIDYICSLNPETEVENGFYDGQIVIETFKPISFILN